LTKLHEVLPTVSIRLLANQEMLCIPGESVRKWGPSCGTGWGLQFCCRSSSRYSIPSLSEVCVSWCVAGSRDH